MEVEVVTRMLTKAKTELLFDAPFFGSVVVMLDWVPDSRFPTAGTDGIRVIFNPEFIEKLTPAQRVFVCAHEAMHVADGHVWRRGSRDLMLWNIACDYAINHILVESGLEAPKGMLHDDHLAGMSPEQIYTILLEKKGEGGNGGQGGNKPRPGNQPGQGGGKGKPGQPGETSPQPPDDGEQEDDDSDDNSDTEDTNPEGSEDNPDADDGVENDSAGDGSDEAEEDPSEGFEDPGGCGGILPEPKGVNAEEAEHERKLLVSQAVAMARAAGKMPGCLERFADKLLNPEVPWEELFAAFVLQHVNNDYNWDKPDKAYLQRDIVMPTMISDELPPVVFLTDTSGSIWGMPDLLDKVPAETSSILSSFETTLYVVYVDTEVKDVEEFSRSDLPFTLKPKGGGGTNFRPGFEWIEANDINPSCAVYFTDGYNFDGFPEEPDYPVVWLVTEDGKPDDYFPWGQVIRLKK